MKYLKYFFILLFLAGIYTGFTACAPHEPSETVLDGTFWKHQGVDEILPKWTQHGVDPEDGRFYAFLDREWNAFRGTEKYPGMMARHLFSYSAAYMMSGRAPLLDKADSLFLDLKTHGWDTQHGGWFYSIDREGNFIDPQKDLFMNIYAATGLAMYYMVTHNREALDLIRQTRHLMRNHAWDTEYAGYYRRLSRDWQVTDASKVFTPQVAPVSGYLLYLFAATKDTTYLDESRELMALTTARLQDSESGWIREGFGPDWKKKQEDKESEENINIGHNIEVAWMLMRLHVLTGSERYLDQALPLTGLLFKHSFYEGKAWVHKAPLNDPAQYERTTPWWVQAYGNMFSLYAYKVTGEQQYLDHFREGARFWNTAFVDSVYGATVLSATLEGEIDRGDKAVRTKTSYHTLEHALLNYLYLNLWVNKVPVTLHFSFNDQSDDNTLCPMPVEVSSVDIQSVEINGEQVSLDGMISNGCIDSTGDGNRRIKVTMK